MNELLMTKKALAEKRKREALEQAFTEDLLHVLETPQGRRVFVKMFKECGIADSMGGQPLEVATYNMGIVWLNRIKAADPRAAMLILAETFELGECNG